MNNVLLAVFGMGGTEMLVIAVVILVLFGARKIPEFAKGLGQGIKEFKKASTDVQSEIQRSMDEPPAPPRPPAPAPAAPSQNPSPSAPKA